jgi:hypothetical protein
MTDRERLIEILKVPIHPRIGADPAEVVADYLLANGVIVPPCKVGDDIYWIDSDTNEIKCAKKDIKAVCYYGNNDFKIITQDESSPEDIGTQWCYLTKEEAENALKEREAGAV